MPSRDDIRRILLEVIAEKAPQGKADGSLQSGSVLQAVSEKLEGKRDYSIEEAILTTFHDLFRTGYLAWGLNLGNPDPPFFHITDQGRRSLENLSRDPSNPDGYFACITSIGQLNPIADSYLKEAINCYVNDLAKSSAVMIGGAAESMALELRDSIVKYLKQTGAPVPAGLKDWRIKVVLDALQNFFDQNHGQLSRELKDSFKSYWPAFTQQIRTIRNDAGHPNSVAPISTDAIHASLLIFPELLKLYIQLKERVDELHDLK